MTAAPGLGKASGMALLTTLVLAAVLALLASSLIRLSFSRTTLFRRTRANQEAQLATASGVGSMQNCLFGKSFPPSGSCPDWGPWSGAGTTRKATRQFSVGPTKFTLEATWHSSGRLDVQANQAP